MISSPSPPRRVGEAFSGLTIEDRRAMTPLGPAPDAHAARGLGATVFVPTGEALLSEELDLPCHGARGGPAGGIGPAPDGKGYPGSQSLIR